MLNWYRIEKILGRGGFGVIYLATDTNLELLVAIKEYIPSDIARRNDDSTVLPITEEHGDMYRWGLDRFIKEARNLVRFKHPNIVRVMSVFQENNTAYMVMEFEEGEDLRRHLKRTGSTTEAAIKKLIEPISEGLAEVHRHGFIHRDIKPANILVRKDGSPVLLDFGSARNATNSGPDGLTALVTIGYAPLEQYASENDEQQGPWTDIYAMGGVLYYAISGNDPIDCTKRGTALFNGGRDPQPSAATIGREHYSAAFLNAIDWSLQLRISDRPQYLDEWVPALMGEVSIGPAATTESDFANGDLTDTIVYTGGRGRGRTTGSQRHTQGFDSGQVSARRNSQRLSGRVSRPVSEQVSGQVSGRASGRASGQVVGRTSRPVSGRVSARDSAQVSGRASKRFVEPEEPLTLSGVSHKRNKQGFAANGQEQVARPAPAPLYEAPQRTSRTGVNPPRVARKRARKKVSKAWFAVAAVLPLAAGLAVLYQRQLDETVLDTAKISESEPAITVAGNPLPDTAAKDVAVPASTSDEQSDSAAKAEAARLEAEEKKRLADEEFRQKRAAQRAAAATRALEAEKARNEDEKLKAIANNELEQKPAEPSNTDSDKRLASGTPSGGNSSAGGDTRPIERIAQRVTRSGNSSPEAPKASDNKSATEKSDGKSGSKAGAAAAATIVADKIVKNSAKTAAASTAAAGASVSDADQAATKSTNAQANANKAAGEAADVQKIIVPEDSIVARAEIQTPVDVETAEEIESRRIQREEAARQKEEERQASERRAARAKKKQLQDSFDTAIRKGSEFVEQGQLDEAGAQVERAEATGISNDTLRNLKERLSNLVMDARRPVSDDDFDGVMTRFDDLRRAIEKKDRPAIERLVRGDTQSQLFNQLLERFERLDIEISNIRVRNADKSISATLRIRQMVRANGDVATPSDAYRERIITSQRLNGEWSIIRW